jgi:hypothetical protein
MTKTRARPLSPAQEAFAQHYASHGNASEAYRTAYPGSGNWKPANLHSKASTLLAKDKVRARVQELLQRVKAIAAAIVGAEMSFTPDGSPAVTVKMADKRAALKDLGQHLGLFKQQDVTVNGGAPIPVVLSSAEAAL